MGTIRGLRRAILAGLCCGLLPGCATIAAHRARPAMTAGAASETASAPASPVQGPPAPRLLGNDPAVRLARAEGSRPAPPGSVPATASSPASTSPPGGNAADEDDEDDDDEDDDEAPGTGPQAPTPSRRERAPERVAIRRPGAVATGERPDFDLNRPRAERAGEGGAPTQKDEEEDRKEEEEFPNPYLLMNALDAEDARVKFYGWMEGSFTANPGVPAGGENFGLFPNSQGNVWLFPQVYFVLERRPEQGDEFDYGFRFDNFLSNGWLGTDNAGLINGRYLPGGFGWDPVQFYGEVHLPIVTEGGVDVKFGRFYALSGYEDGIAPGRPLLSTGYQFSYSHPFAQLGVMSTWHMTRRFNWYHGISLYNTSIDGYNRLFNIQGAVGYTGGFSWDLPDDRTNLTVSLDVGSNIFPAYPVVGAPTGRGLAPVHGPGPRDPPDPLPDRFAALATQMLTHQWTDRLSTIVEADEAVETGVPGLQKGSATSDASWFGIAGWALYDFTDRWTGVCRLESFWDVKGTRTGYPTAFQEATVGAIYKPRPWLWFRPEVRGDWSDRFTPFNNGKSASQLTFGFDVIFLF